MNQINHTDSIFEHHHNGEDIKLDYTLVGDYYIPNLTSGEEQTVLGIWARRRVVFLKEHKPVTYLNLLTKSKLTEHLKDVDKQADFLMQNTTYKIMEDEGVDEILKRENPLRWVGLINNILNRAQEIVDAEIIYR